MARNTENISRADQVRARRKIEPVHRKPVPNKAEKISRDEKNSSKVVARRTNYTSYASRNSNNKNRKRVYLSTGVAGKEILLPALPSIKLSWRILSGIISIGMLTLLYMMLNAEYFKISTLNLNGGIRVPSEEILPAIDVKGSSIISIIPEDIEENIVANFPDIKSAQVVIDMPNRLDIFVDERIPAILWFKDGESQYWIDQDGYIFTVRGEATLPIQVFSDTEPPHPIGYVPINLAEPGTEAEINQLPPVDPAFVSAVQKLNIVKPAGVPMLHKVEGGLGWTDPNGWDVFFGNSTEDMDMKLAEYAEIVKVILAKNLQPVLISMEFLHAPYYRLEH